MFNLKNVKNIAIIGASGAIGQALINTLSKQCSQADIHAFSRTPIQTTKKNVFPHSINYLDEQNIQQSAQTATQTKPLDLVIVATGMLHNSEITPEKSMKEITADKMAELFTVNTITPSLIAKHFLPSMHHNKPILFAALSARVGSVSDNYLGGWYAYRTSKAALNMMIKTFAIEMARTNKESIIIGLHPGTVKSSLSKPFQKNVKPEKLFSPEFSSQQLIQTIQTKTHADTGKVFAWDDTEIKP